MLLELPAARDCGEHRGGERVSHLLGVVELAVGLLAEEREADTEQEAEEDPEDDRLNGAAGLLLGHEALLDDAWAGAHSDEGLEPGRVLTPVTADGATVLGAGQVCQLPLDDGKRLARDVLVVLLDEAGRGLGVGVRQEGSVLGIVRRGHHVHDIGVLGRGDGHVLLDVGRRKVHSLTPKLFSGGIGDAPRIDGGDIVLGEVVRVRRGRLQPESAEFGADRLVEEQLRRRLVAVAGQEGERSGGPACEQGREHDDQPAPAEDRQQSLRSALRRVGAVARSLRDVSGHAARLQQVRRT